MHCVYTYVYYLPFADDYKSTVATSGGILSLTIIPVIMLTVICCVKKKSNAKVFFTKCDGTFKVTTEYVVHQQTKSPNCNEQKQGNNQNKQKLDNVASIGSDVVISPNPSYDVGKSDKEKFTLSESLYISCEQSTGDETVKEKSSEQQAMNDGKRKGGKALNGARECNNALHAGYDVPPSRSTSCNNGTPPAQIFEDSLQQTATCARKECDNALYEATVHAGDVTMTRNPSYNMIPEFQNSYEYITPLTCESPTQQNDGTMECDDAYDYVYEICDDDSSHDYSSIKASDDDHDDALTTKDNVDSNVTKRGMRNPSYGRKVTVLKKTHRSGGNHSVTTVQEVAI